MPLCLTTGFHRINRRLVSIIPCFFLWKFQFRNLINFSKLIISSHFFQSGWILSGRVVYYQISKTILSFSFIQWMLFFENSETLKLIWSYKFVEEILSLLDKHIPRIFSLIVHGEMLLEYLLLLSRDSHADWNFLLANISESRANTDCLLSVGSL